MTTIREAPRPEKREVLPLDVELSWLMQQLDASLKVAFKIDRSSGACRMPRRNPQVDEALGSAAALHRWSTSAYNYKY